MDLPAGLELTSTVEPPDWALTTAKTAMAETEVKAESILNMIQR